MRCDTLEPLFEAVADGTAVFEPADAAHVAACEVCARRLEHARLIDQWLAARAVEAPPARFTNAVMRQMGQEQWKMERAVDMGFNLAILAGVLVIIAAGTGLLWSLGLVTVTADLGSIWRSVGTGMTARLVSQMRTLAMSAVLLTMALALWWWAEAASD